MTNYTGHLAILLLGLIIAIALYIIVLGLWPDTATIGGTNVPAIHCQEDEVISWTGIDTLGCVHFEEIN